MLIRRIPVARHEDREVQALATSMDHAADGVRLQVDSAATPVAQANGNPEVTLAAGASMEIFHHLGREPQRFRYCVWIAAGVVDGSVVRTASDKTSITLRNDATVTVTIRVEVS